MFSRPDEEEYDQYRGQEDGAWYEDDYFYDDHDSYAYDDVTQLYSEVVPALPMECSDQAPVARCNAKFHYIITSKRAFQYTCADGVETLQSTPEAVQFRAHQCGYDLIQWEAAVILKEPGPHPSLQIPTCGIKGQDGRASLQCGEVPDGELLPGGCLHMREPAVFKFEVHKDVDVEGKLVLDQWETWSQLYVVKFFDNGWSAIHSPKLSPYVHSNALVLHARPRYFDWGVSPLLVSQGHLFCRNNVFSDAECGVLQTRPRLKLPLPATLTCSLPTMSGHGCHKRNPWRPEVRAPITSSFAHTKDNHMFVNLNDGKFAASSTRHHGHGQETCAIKHND